MYCIMSFFGDVYILADNKDKLGQDEAFCSKNIRKPNDSRKQ